jgi:translation initiation factor 2B subunit (eIF-2B alpha/beta/delta family)
MNNSDIHHSILSQIDDIRNDNLSGANELALRAIEVIQNQLDLIAYEDRDIKDLFLKLVGNIIRVRPSMAPLINSMGFLISNIDEFTKGSIFKAISLFYKFQTKKQEKLQENFKLLLNRLALSEISIITLSYSSTLLNIIQSAKDFSFNFYVLESRPLLEGQKLAEILSKTYETHLIVDAALGKFIDHIDLVLIGVDSILKDGSIINKIGTYPLAALAKSSNKQVYVICDSFKYNLWSHYGIEVKIEEKPINEVYNKKVFSDSLNVHNYYFDITPAKFLDIIISDLGVLSVNDFLRDIEKNLPINWFKQFI